MALFFSFMPELSPMNSLYLNKKISNASLFLKPPYSNHEGIYKAFIECHLALVELNDGLVSKRNLSHEVAALKQLMDTRGINDYLREGTLKVKARLLTIEEKALFSDLVGAIKEKL